MAGCLKFRNKMRLENNFYKIDSIEQQDGSYKIVVEILADHPIYEGHFPQQAVVPGVCTLTIIRECIGKILDKSVEFESIKECKYVSALIPCEGLTIVINLTIADATKVSAMVVRGDNQQAVLKLKANLR